MPLREYEFEVNLRGDIVRVRVRTERGEVVDFVAQYEAVIDGERRPVGGTMRATASPTATC